MEWLKTKWLIIKWVGITLAIVIPAVAYIADQRTISECRAAREALAIRAVKSELRIDELVRELESVRNERDTLKQVKVESAARSVADALILPSRQSELTNRLIQLKVKENELKNEAVCDRVLGLLDTARMQQSKKK